MSGPMEILLVGAAAVLVIGRLFRANQVGQGRWWLLPVVLGFLAFSKHDLVDPHHEGSSVALLVLELVIGLLIGAGWAWTSRVWTESDGTVWSKGTKAAAAVWAGGILVRVALYGVGSALDIRQGSAALMLGLAATFLARGGVLLHRAGLLRSTYGVNATAEGPSAWKDRA